MSSQNFLNEMSTKFAWVKVQFEELNVRISRWLDRLQAMLEYQGIENPEFQGNGLGKIGTSGFVLGALFGSNVSLFAISLFVVLFINSSFWVACLMIWGLYATFLTGFHFLEFLITALRQPGHVSYDSFIINHSKSYTFAAGKLYILILILICDYNTFINIVFNLIYF